MKDSNIDQGQNYKRREEIYSKLIQKQNKTINAISYLRLTAFVIGAGTTSYLFFKSIYIVGSLIFIVSTGIFIYLVIKHSKLIKNKKFSAIMKEINLNSQKRMDGSWKDFQDSGDEFIDSSHNYASDLDVFGRGSLFQLINSTSTYLGRKRLRNMITTPCRDKSEISERQEAVKELTPSLYWRQRFQAEGIVVSNKLEDPESLINWAKETKDFYRNNYLRILFKVIPLVTIVVILLSFLGIVPGFVRSAAISIQILLLIPGYGERASTLATVYTFQDSIRTYEGLISKVEKRNFNAEYLKRIKKEFINNSGNTASIQIKSLMKITDKISDRGNFFFIVFNILFLLDYQRMFDLEGWKKQSGLNIGKWLETVGEFEALCSLANLGFDNPEWVMPTIEDGKMIIIADEVGHPLLGRNRVTNNFSIGESSDILLITGSNMSGKSTLLRTAGINLVLAYAGAPVCAAAMRCSIMDIYTCMRIGDNLENNISSFYAEILRIKMIVKAVKERRSVFFLLDEIFKGTNSIDRHTGAKVLIRQLERDGAIGMVSTHDLELGELEREGSGKIRNYHFREYYSNNELHFDYKLRSGVSDTRNAMYLIKMAGIEVDK